MPQRSRLSTVLWLAFAMQMGCSRAPGSEDASFEDAGAPADSGHVDSGQGPTDAGNSPCDGGPCAYSVVARTVLVSGGGRGPGRPTWSPDGDWIGYDTFGTANKYDAWRMHPDGGGAECLTCNIPEIPGNNGAPDFDVSGRFMVFTAEAAQHAPVSGTGTDPGGGIFDDVAVLDLTTRTVTRLTQVPTGLLADGGVGGAIGGNLFPSFSPDGTRIAWGALINFNNAPAPNADGGHHFGNWAMAVAPFTGSPSPELGAPGLYAPVTASTQVYEMQGWDPDGSGLYVDCSPLPGQDDFALDVCHFDLLSQTLTRITHSSGVQGEPAYYEEQVEPSPRNDAVVYMGSEPQVSNDATFFVDWLRSDLWIAGLDGSGRQRLTFFNEPGHPESDPGGNRVMVARMYWAPDASAVVARVYYVNVESDPTDDVSQVQIFRFNR